MAKAQQDWADLIAEIDAERARGHRPRRPEACRPLADRWRALIEAFTGGDPGIAASLKRMYDEEGPEKASRGAVNPELMEYAGRAMRSPAVAAGTAPMREAVATVASAWRVCRAQVDKPSTERPRR